MTDPGHHERVTRLFLEIVDLDPKERSLRLAAAGPEGSPTRSEVERMLGHDSVPPRLLAEAALSARSRERSLGPREFGPYTIVRILGQGGMGTVYEASASESSRNVALKVLHPWLDSPELRSRFERETRLLRLLDHDGIARVIDAGVVTTPIGTQPYLAMELVKGSSILAHATERSLSVMKRLELLAAVCDAVDHAHRRGVIHRDLKPANLLVDERGAPRVVDFGIARTVGTTEWTTLLTESRSILGTLQYMSPEQAEGRSKDVDARSDVYSLGVVGYELLTDALPLEVGALPLPEALRRIADVDPTPAGDRVTALRGDVETILSVMLEKEPARRYPTAAAVADDIRRHLAGRPIAARPRSAAHQVARFARRHRGLVGGVVATIVALAVGLAFAVHFAFEAREERTVAIRERQESERQAYRATMMLASTAHDAGNWREFRQSLDSAHPALRGFEWRHLDRAFDASLARHDATGSIVLRIGFEEEAATGASLAVVDSQGVNRRHRFDHDAGRLELDDSAPSPNLRVLEATGRMLLLQRADGALVIRDRDTDLDDAVTFAAPGRARVWAFAPENGCIAAVSGSRLAIVDPYADRLIASFAVPRSTSFSPAIDPDGARLALPTTDGRVLVVRTDDGSVVSEFTTKSPARRFAFSPDGAWLAVTCDEGIISRENEILLFDAATLEIHRVIRGDPELILSLVFDASSRRLAVGLVNGALRIYDVSSGARTAELRGARTGVEAIAFSRDGRFLAAGDRRGSVLVFTAEDPADYEVLRGHASYVYPIAFRPQGDLLASGSWDATVRLWDVASAECLGVLRGHADYVHDLAFDPTGTMLLTSSRDLTTRLWDVATGLESARIDLGEPIDVNAVAWSGDGKWIALGAGNPQRRSFIVDAVTRTVVHDLGRAKGYVNAVAFAPSSRELAVADSGGRVALYSVEEGRPVSSREFRTGARSLAYADDGSELAVSLANGRIALIDPTTLESRIEFAAHEGEAFSVVFAPDGSRIASGGRDGLVRVFDRATGQAVAKFTGHSEYVYCVRFERSGELLASGSGDGTIRLFGTEPLRERILARSRAARERVAIAPRLEEWLSEHREPAAVMAAIEAEFADDPASLRAARTELRRRLTGVEGSVPGR